MKLDKNGKPVPITPWKGSWAEQMQKDKPIHCPECAKQRGVPIPANCPHKGTTHGKR
jgi:hypothetical protein